MKIRRFKITIFVCLVVLAGMMGCSVAYATESYPSKPIRIIIPYSAGGSSDIVARMLAPRLSKILGQPVIVENITGAGGWVGWNTLMKERPDGYTIAEFTLTYIAGYLNPEMKRTQNLDSVALLVNHIIDYTAWAAKPDFPFKNMKDLLAYAKDNPGKIKVATSGVNTQHHRLLIQLEKLGYKFQPVHTNGVADEIAMVLGGHVDIASIGAGDVRKQMDQGALVGLAVMSPKRSVFLPTVPTLKESTGLKLQAYAARGFAGPANMDSKAVSTLNKAFKTIMTDPNWIKEMESVGQEVKFIDNNHYRPFLKEVEKDYKDALGW